MRSSGHHREAVKMFAVSFADALRTARKKSGLSLAALGELTGMNRICIGRIERGERTATFGVCAVLVDALGMYLDEIIEDQ